MRKFKHVKDGRIIKVLEVFEKSGVMLVEFEDGSTTNYSPSTIKRWWKELPEEEVEKTEAAQYVEASQKITKELNKNNSKSLQEMVDAQADDVAGDGTTYKEVMQEILQDEKKAIEKAKKKKTAEKTGTKKSSRVDSEELPGILSFIDETAGKINATSYIRDKQPSLLNYRVGEGKVLFVARKTHKEVQLLFKSKTVPAKYLNSLEAVNGFYDKKLVVAKLDATNKSLIDKIISSMIKEETK